MDFLGPRAVPALIALAFAAPAFAADCASIEGTYQYRAEKADNDTDTFNRLVLLPQGEARKLYKFEASRPQGFGSAEPRQRQKATHFATRARIQAGQVQFLDASGAMLVQVALDSGGKWTCSGDRLERSSENMTGVGDAIRTDRLDESLRREGELLVFSETRTTIDPPGGKPRKSEKRFRTAP